MDIERPVKSPEDARRWGSDYLADVIRSLDLKYVAVTPGASFRGLHDSLVNHLGNEDPKMLLCLHEEHTVSLAHGYAKVTGEPMGVIVHSNVGLMHATMTIFNAWCDRIPVMIFGATGAVDAARRRPWIEWIHTSIDQAALVRGYTKWDDQPVSLPAAAESMLRANMLARTAPRAPVYVCFDVNLQEERAPDNLALPDVSRFKSPLPQQPAAEDIKRAAALLVNARKPVILIGRVARRQQGWDARVALAEALNAAVVTDIKQGAVFPTHHPLMAAAPGLRVPEPGMQALRDADVVLSLDWVDLAGMLKTAMPDGAVPDHVMHCSVDSYIHRGWSMDYQGLAPMDMQLMCEPDVLVPLLLEEVRKLRAAQPATQPARSFAPVVKSVPAAVTDPDRAIGIRDFGWLMQRLNTAQDLTYIRLPLGWSGDTCRFEGPYDFIGSDGGGGIGAGPGMAVGAALALRDSHSERVPVAILGDGDFMMGCSAVWTAARYQLPLLILVSNNQSFFNDELHQERVAIQRGRPVENKWIGQHIGGPDIDIAALARAQGVEGFGPVLRAGDLEAVIVEALAQVRAGKTCVVDVRVRPEYDAP